MFAHLRRKRAKAAIKRAWTAHQRLTINAYTSREARLQDLMIYAEAMADISFLFGITDTRSPDEWED